MSEKNPLAPITKLPPISVDNEAEPVLRNFFSKATLEEKGALIRLLDNIKQTTRVRSEELLADAFKIRSAKDTFLGQSNGLQEATDVIVDCIRELNGFPIIEYTD